eukprot:scaffold63068_cov23-Tisochrysis_lutea.AAC.2
MDERSHVFLTGVDEALHREWDRESIRVGVLQQRQGFWKTLQVELQSIFDSHDVHVDAVSYTNEHFVHKMGL